MHVGVFPDTIMTRIRVTSLPHARGGVSASYRVQDTKVLSSPCTWGCFHPRQSDTRRNSVFPMHVGVFLSKTLAPIDAKGLPHARGGVSIAGSRHDVWFKSSPCTWGCFLLPSNFPFLYCVFPMHVGVFLICILY